MRDQSLVRCEGYSALPEAAALRAQLELEEAQSLKHGIHLIAVQSADGSLVVGDSQHYGSAPQPFASEAVDQLMLRHMHEALHIDKALVVERWTGIYPASAEAPLFCQSARCSDTRGGRDQRLGREHGVWPGRGSLGKLVVTP